MFWALKFRRRDCTPGGQGTPKKFLLSTISIQVGAASTPGSDSTWANSGFPNVRRLVGSSGGRSGKAHSEDRSA
jgi:hypothetical protein